MIHAYRSYAYLLTEAEGDDLELIKALFHDCEIKKVPEVSYYTEAHGTNYLYLIRIGNNGRFIQTVEQNDYDITIAVPAGPSTYSGMFSSETAYNVDLRDYPNAIFTAHSVH